jgi:hypothetical protein
MARSALSTDRAIRVTPGQRIRVAGRVARWAALLLLAAAVLVPAVSAQDEEPTAIPLTAKPISQLFITGTNPGAFPNVELLAYGRDPQGNPINFAAESLVVTHDGIPSDFVSYEGARPVGTLTVFLIDAPTGIADQFGAIRDAIQQYASAGNMQEQLDQVAVYQIGPDGPRELLAPTSFYNAVANLFVSDLVPEEGLTALIDSTVQLLERIPGLRTNPTMAAHLVVISDGTDAASTQYQAGDVAARSREVGVPVHTIHVTNPELGEAGNALGTRYLGEVAADSGGVAAELGTPEGLPGIWNRITSFRDHALIRYTVPVAAGGTFPVELYLRDEPNARASSEVTISAALPSVTLDLPLDARLLSVPALDEPIDMRLSAAVTWLDGQTRAITDAGLIVNDERVADIPIDRLDDFRAPVSNLIYGDNRLEIAVTDDQGFTASSGPVVVTVTEGERSVPEALAPSGIPLWASILGLLAGLALVIGAGTLLWRALRGGPTTASERSRRRRAQQGVEEPVPYVPPSPAEGGLAPAQAGPYAPRPFVMAHLQVLQSQTLMNEEITLGEAEVRIGRSPTQSDIIFRDDITVSRAHAIMRLEGNHYRIYDAGSTSGTFVNDRRVPDYGLELADGDQIQLGAVRLLYHQL